MIEENYRNDVPTHATGKLHQPIAHTFVGMFNDVRGGFIGSKLDVIHILGAKAACARDIPHELSDLIEKFKLRSKLNRLHRVFKKLPSVTLITKGSLLPDENGWDLRTITGLKMTHSSQGVIKGLKEFSEAGQFQRFTNTSGNIDQNNFAPVIFLAIALRSQQSAEPGTGHILQRTHINSQFILSTLVGGLERLRHFRGGCAIHTTLNRNQIAMLKFLGGNFHGTSSILKVRAD